MHQIVKTFTVGGFAQGSNSIGRETVVVCRCGWKEKALTDAEAGARFDKHAGRPNA